MRWNLLITAPGFKYTISLPKLESSSRTTELAVFGTIDVVETMAKRTGTRFLHLDSQIDSVINQINSDNNKMALEIDSIAIHQHITEMFNNFEATIIEYVSHYDEFSNKVKSLVDWQEVISQAGL